MLGNLLKSPEATEHAEGMDESRSLQCLEAIRRNLGAVLRMPPGDIDAERPLTSLGLDSLTVLELKSAIERDLGMTLPLTAVLQGSNLGQLAGEVARLRSEPVAEGGLPRRSPSRARQGFAVARSANALVCAPSTRMLRAPTTLAAQGGSGAGRRDGLAAGRRSDDRTSRVAAHGIPDRRGAAPGQGSSIVGAGRPAGGSGCSWRPWPTAMIVD